MEISKTLFLLKSAAKYYLKSDTIFNIHSPFVFEFVRDILEDKRNFYAFELIKKLKYEFSKNETIVDIIDLGAGSLLTNSNKRTISTIAKNSVASEQKLHFLFKLCNKYKPQSVLELGTSLGISSLVMQLANTTSHITTIEGDNSLASFACTMHSKNQLEEIEIVNAPFDNYLESLNPNKTFDLILIDGNHAYKPTTNYFKKLLQHINNESIMIFDDINWSADMRMAWEEIKSDNLVTLSIETFEYGVLFFKAEFKEKQHFSIIPTKWKPWNIGLF
jgi:predicted O-methyltransferase YrrM